MHTIAKERAWLGRLTLLYSLALATIALMAFLGQALVWSALQSQSGDAHVINLAGRQRMLNQRLSKAALVLERSTAAHAPGHQPTELELVLALWQRTHLGLQKGDTGLALRGINSPTVQGMFLQIDPHFQAMAGAARQLAAIHRASPGQVEAPIQVNRILAHEAAFLEQMDRIVFQYDREAQEHLDSLGRFEALQFGITLLVLLLEGLFVFRPASKQISRTIAELRQAQQLLAAEKELAQVTLRSIGDGVVTTDAGGRVVALNATAEQLTGWSSSEAQGQALGSIMALINEHTRVPVPNPVHVALAEGQTVSLAPDTLLVSRFGIEIAVDDSAAPIRDSDGRVVGAVLVFRDVSRERDRARTLAHQAGSDPLTGLVNRRAFERYLEQACQDTRNGERHALCCIDLDRFKCVNDTAGHQAGDALLQEVAVALRRHVRATDVVARLGGDEFAVLFRECSLSNAAAIAEQLREAIGSLQFCWEGSDFRIGASIGLAPIESGTGIAQVMHTADSACYTAKRNGRDRVQWGLAAG